MQAATAIDMRGSEESLMAAYVDGDTSAFPKLFRTLGPRVHRFFLRKFGDSAVADDMQQITFMKMHRARKAYRSGEPVRPWLFTIAARVRIDELRRRRRRLLESGDEAQIGKADAQAAIAESGLDSIERADLAAKVREALATLPESQRRVIKLHRYEGLTFKEIARRIGTTEAAVKLRAFRAYGHLRKRLEPVLSESTRI